MNTRILDISNVLFNSRGIIFNFLYSDQSILKTRIWSIIYYICLENVCFLCICACLTELSQILAKLLAGSGLLLSVLAYSGCTQSCFCIPVSLFWFKMKNRRQYTIRWCVTAHPMKVVVLSTLQSYYTIDIIPKNQLKCYQTNFRMTNDHRSFLQSSNRDLWGKGRSPALHHN